MGRKTKAVMAGLSKGLSNASEIVANKDVAKQSLYNVKGNYLNAMKATNQGAGIRASAQKGIDAIAKNKSLDASAKAMSTQMLNEKAMLASGSYKDIYNNLKTHNASNREILDTLAGETKDSYSPNLTDKALAAGSVASDYFWTGASGAQRAARIGTAAAAYGTAAGATRYLSGGSMSYNSKGERDIAGVPFL